MAIATSASFVRELKEEIASSGLVIKEHPLVQGVYRGTLPKHQLRGWATQDSHYRRAVPRLATLRYLRCTDPEFQRKLGGVMTEEAEGGQYGQAGHYQLFLTFARALGLTEEEVENSRPLAGTAAHIYWAELIAWTLPWFVAMSAQLAGEGQAPPAVMMVNEGLQKHYGLTAEEAAFFHVHGEADQDHGTLTEEIIARYIVTPELQAEARAVIRRKLELQWDMWSTFEAY
ncbi:MAG TPA: iron-containing redox enzyme family protein [Chloroflexota bacterium]|nr:iron-containing redox enzyme family protein [Chloroflexota bacterium]